MRYLYSLLILGFLLFLGCPAAETAGPEELTAEETPAVTVEEAPTIEEAVPETAAEITEAETTAAETTTEEAPPSTPAEELTPTPKMGFRVQIGAFEFEEGANKIKVRAESEINQRVYVDFIEGMYKVRVGDFLTKEYAQSFREKLISMGYNGAFLVETEISP